MNNEVINLLGLLALIYLAILLYMFSFPKQLLINVFSSAINDIYSITEQCENSYKELLRTALIKEIDSTIPNQHKFLFKQVLIWISVSGIPATIIATSKNFLAIQALVIESWISQSMLLVAIYLYHRLNLQKYKTIAEKKTNKTPLFISTLYKQLQLETTQTSLN